MKLLTHFRWMVRSDLPAVLEIERQCFEDPWDTEDFIWCMRNRKCIPMAAEQDGRVVGFMLYDLHHNRIHVRNFAIHPDYQRCGIGRAMIGNLAGKLSHARRSRIMVEVRETNLVAQLFFRSLGFRAIAVLPDFYDNVVEDAYLMQYRHVPTADELEELTVNRVLSYLPGDRDS